MERLVPDMLRAYANALEDKRRADNIESCRRFPEFDQKMLLALNDAPTVDQLPDAGTILKQLQQRLISVTTADGQGASLGLFYTNADPFNIKRARPAVGIFHLYTKITNYHLRPEVDLYLWQSRGKLTIADESAMGEDPFIIPNPEGPEFMFFQQSPFSDVRPYRTVLPENPKAYLLENPKPHEEALEQNVIERALWIENVADEKAYLFKQKGFDKFIRDNRRDVRYSELYATFRRSYGSYSVFKYY